MQTAPNHENVNRLQLSGAKEAGWEENEALLTTSLVAMMAFAALPLWCLIAMLQTPEAVVEKLKTLPTLSPGPFSCFFFFFLNCCNRKSLPNSGSDSLTSVSDLSPFLQRNVLYPASWHHQPTSGDDRARWRHYAK